jgi:hypothetical protein
MWEKKVTLRALLLRVNRQLEAEGSQLQRCRENARDYSALGPYYLVRGGQIVERKLNLADYAKKLKLLKPYEVLESEEK